MTKPSLLKAAQALYRDDETRAPGRAPMAHRAGSGRFERTVEALRVNIEISLFILFALAISSMRCGNERTPIALPATLASPAPAPENGATRPARLAFPAQGESILSRRLPSPAPSSRPSQGPSRREIERHAVLTATTYQIPPGLLLSVIEQESQFNIYARGKHGEIGLMQLRPQTARETGVNPYDWRQNIIGGARWLIKHYWREGEWPAAVRRYNGAGAMAWKYQREVFARWESRSAD